MRAVKRNSTNGDRESVPILASSWGPGVLAGVRLDERRMNYRRHEASYTFVSMQRRRDIIRFYGLLDLLEEKVGGKRGLRDCSGHMTWPRRGVYFFFEKGEIRSDSGKGERVVRVGTHALQKSSSTTLWQRLSQHRGTVRTGGGNHRGSIFRLIAGTALAEKEGGMSVATWGQGSTADPATRAGEQLQERRVSEVIGAMPFLWLEVDDEPGPKSLRAIIERSAIAMLSNFERPALDPASPRWLGHFSDRERVRGSGLWNQNHVDEAYDPAFLDVLEGLIGGTR